MCGTGLIFSLGNFFEDEIVDGEIGNGTLELLILGFQLLESVLIHLHPAVFVAQAVIGLIGNTELLLSFRHRLTLHNQEIKFAELFNDLFGVVSIPRQGSDLLYWIFTTLDLDQGFQTSSEAFLPPNLARRFQNSSELMRWSQFNGIFYLSTP